MGDSHRDFTPEFLMDGAGSIPVTSANLLSECRLMVSRSARDRKNAESVSATPTNLMLPSSNVPDYYSNKFHPENIGSNPFGSANLIQCVLSIW